ncbi:SRPBCC family protein [Actinokineospora sp. 24-640]
MVAVIRKFSVDKSAEAVIAYLEDFSRTVEWDPGTVSCDRIDSGPVRIGSTWRNVSKFLGQETRLTYELVTRQPNRLVFEGKNKTATTSDDITVVPGATPGSSDITYRAVVTFNGAAKLATPLAKLAFEALGRETEASLIRTLGDNKR